VTEEMIVWSLRKIRKGQRELQKKDVKAWIKLGEKDKSNKAGKLESLIRPQSPRCRRGIFN
jgi:hypothetical protein